jgi:hypothetical protein
VDCPLGAACPSGGKHKPGSKKLDRHTQQAQKQGLTGKPAGDESKGEDAGKPGVTAATQNIGSVGSDQPTGVGPGEEKPTLLSGEEKAPEEKAAGGIFESEESRQRLKEWASARTTGDESDSELDKMFEEYRAARDVERFNKLAERQSAEKEFSEKVKAPLEGEAATGMPGVPRPKGLPRVHKEFVGAASKRGKPVQDTPEYAKYVSDISERVKAPLAGEAAAGAGAVPAPSKKKPTVPTSLEEMADSAPPESKPMDHYRLAEVARLSGDSKAESKHEALARERSSGMMSADHKKLAEQLRAENFTAQAKYHDDIAARAATPPKLPKQRQIEQEQKVQQEHSAKFQSVHAEQKAKAKKLLDDAKAVHEETKRKAGDILARNKKAIEDHKAAMADYEEKKEKGVKKLKKPKNPKLEREISVPDKPGLSEPESDSENLKHMSHTERAKKHADMIESHLRHNKNLTDDQRKQLERAHAISSFHSNIEHTPTAAHKAELAAAEEHTKKLGIKKPMQEPDDTIEVQDSDIEEELQDSDVQELSHLETAQMHDHASRAQTLKNNLQSHLQNPDLADSERAKIESAVNALGQHENLGVPPTPEQAKELKQLHSLAGKEGKTAYSAPEEAEVDEATEGGAEGGAAAGDEEGGDEGSVGPLTSRRRGSGRRSGLQYLLSKVEEGRAGGAAMAAAATSPSGAGRLGTQAVNYGIHGAVSFGHDLLDGPPGEVTSYPGGGSVRAKQDQEAAKTEKQAMSSSAAQGTAAAGAP